MATNVTAARHLGKFDEVGDAARFATDVPSGRVLYRVDSFLDSAVNSYGIGKSHISAGDLVPANLSGIYNGRQVSVGEHILGGLRVGEKSHSPFTSVTPVRDIAIGFGNEFIELDVGGLRRAIRSGELTDVVILNPRQVQRLIKNNKNLPQKLRNRALRWSTRDQEFLIYGRVPRKFFRRVK